MKGGEFSGRIGLLLAIGLPVFILAYVNLAIYPLTTSHPNYSDVDRVFSRFQFPASWHIVDTTEEKGIAGRQCSFEQGAYCFSKSVEFTIPENATIEDVKQVLLNAGCSAVEEPTDYRRAEDRVDHNLRCTIEGLGVGSFFNDKENHFDVQVNA